VGETVFKLYHLLESLRSLSDYRMKGQLTFIVNIYNMMHMRKTSPNFTGELAVCNFAITCSQTVAV